MTTLTTIALREFQLDSQEDYPVIATDVIYQGAAVGENGSGYARPLKAGDPFLGFAIATADNSAGEAGDVSVTVRTEGRVRLTVAGATEVTANDRPLVYASDDATFTLTASTNSPIGRVQRWLASTDCIVEFNALHAIEAAATAAALALKANKT